MPYPWGFPGGSVVKENPPANTGDAGDAGSIPGSGRSPGIGALFLTGKFHGQRSQAGYSSWGHKELDTTELLSTHTHIGILCSDSMLMLIISQ